MSWREFLDEAQWRAIRPIEVRAAITLLEKGWPWSDVVLAIKRDGQSLAHRVKLERRRLGPKIDEAEEARKLRETVA